MLGQRYVLVLIGNVPARLHGLGESYCRNVSDSELGLNAAIRPIPATFRMRLLAWQREDKIGVASHDHQTIESVARGAPSYLLRPERATESGYTV